MDVRYALVVDDVPLELELDDDDLVAAASSAAFCVLTNDVRPSSTVVRTVSISEATDALSWFLPASLVSASPMPSSTPKVTCCWKLARSFALKLG